MHAATVLLVGRRLAIDADQMASRCARGVPKGFVASGRESSAADEPEYCALSLLDLGGMHPQVNLEERTPESPRIGPRDAVGIGSPSQSDWTYERAGEIGTVGKHQNRPRRPRS